MCGSRQARGDLCVRYSRHVGLFEDGSRTSGAFVEESWRYGAVAMCEGIYVTCERGSERGSCRGLMCPSAADHPR